MALRRETEPDTKRAGGSGRGPGGHRDLIRKNRKLVYYAVALIVLIAVLSAFCGAAAEASEIPTTKVRDKHFCLALHKAKQVRDVKWKELLLFRDRAGRYDELLCSSKKAAEQEIATRGLSVSDRADLMPIRARLRDLEVLYRDGQERIRLKRRGLF